MREILEENDLQADPSRNPLEQPAPLPDPTDEVDCVVIGTRARAARPCWPASPRLACGWWLWKPAPAATPKQDYATDEKAQNFLFWNDERLFGRGRNPVAFGKNNSGTGVGGSTLHYTAYTPPRPPRRPDPAH